MALESSIYFYCDSLREDSPLLRGEWMEERERGGFISPSYKSLLREHGDIPFAEWSRFLEKNRKLLLRDCTSATIDVGIMADFQIADFTLSYSPICGQRATRFSTPGKNCWPPFQRGQEAWSGSANIPGPTAFTRSMCLRH